MKTIIGTKADVAKELTAQVAAVLASKPEAKRSLPGTLPLTGRRSFRRANTAARPARVRTRSARRFRRSRLQSRLRPCTPRTRTRMPSTRRTTTPPFRQPGDSIW